ncbi:hypothetical protein [Thalassobacillus devorans]|uniref:hypothetical protein n=1 Tax=Thalassobacillus devorans TaxID=279813 RepID=UPI0020CAB791|nr:hypothetical protein [Thalassobacillus devorans]
MKKYGARVQEKFKTALSKKRVWTLLVLVVVLAGMIFYHTSYKALPEGLSYEGDVHELEDIEFIYNLTYPDPEGESVQELRIFDEVNDMISKAEEFVVIDMFFFNSYTDGIEGLPELSGNLADALIAQKKKHPDLKVVFITDRVNTVYDSYQPKEIERLRNHDIDVVMTSLEELRDSNPLYSSVWRLFFQWFGQEGNGWIPNPMASDAPEVTFRSYMDMMNIKANHRKTVVTEKEAMVSSANPHDI